MGLIERLKRAYEEHRLEKLEQYVQSYPARRAKQEQKQLRALQKYEVLRMRLGGAAKSAKSISPESGTVKGR